MQIESLEIKNYRLFRDAKLVDLPRLTIVVGANGSGKSTLFDIFSFLKEALNHNVAQAVARRGGAGSRNWSVGGQAGRSASRSSFGRAAAGWQPIS